MYNSFLISTGSTTIPGFVERLQKELELLAPNKLKVVAHEHRADLACFGANKYLSEVKSPKWWTTTHWDVS